MSCENNSKHRRYSGLWNLLINVWPQTSLTIKGKSKKFVLWNYGQIKSVCHCKAAFRGCAILTLKTKT